MLVRLYASHMTFSSQSGQNGTKTSGDHNTEADFHGFLRDDRPSKPKKAVSSQWKDVKELLVLLTHFPLSPGTFHPPLNGAMRRFKISR